MYSLEDNNYYSNGCCPSINDHKPHHHGNHCTSHLSPSPLWRSPPSHGYNRSLHNTSIEYSSPSRHDIYRHGGGCGHHSLAPPAHSDYYGNTYCNCSSNHHYSPSTHHTRCHSPFYHPSPSPLSPLSHQCNYPQRGHLFPSHSISPSHVNCASRYTNNNPSPSPPLSHQYTQRKHLSPSHSISPSPSHPPISPSRVSRVFKHTNSSHHHHIRHHPIPSPLLKHTSITNYNINGCKSPPQEYSNYSNSNNNRSIREVNDELIHEVKSSPKLKKERRYRPSRSSTRRDHFETPPSSSPFSSLKRSSSGRIIKPVLNTIDLTSAGAHYHYSHEGEFLGLTTPTGIIDLTLDDREEEKEEIMIVDKKVKNNVKNETKVNIKKRRDTGKKKKTKSVRFNTPNDEWSPEEIAKLKKVVYNTPAICLNFWEEVSKQMKRSSDECRQQYEGNNKPMNKQSECSSSLTITGGRGTIQRKRQLRHIIEEIESHSLGGEDAFNCTPLRKKLKRIQNSGLFKSEIEEDNKEEVPRPLNGKGSRSHNEKVPHPSHYESPVTYKHKLGSPLLSSPSLIKEDPLCCRGSNKLKKRQNADVFVQRFQKNLKPVIKKLSLSELPKTVRSASPKSSVKSTDLSKQIAVICKRITPVYELDISRDEKSFIEEEFNETISDLDEQFEKILKTL